MSRNTNRKPEPFAITAPEPRRPSGRAILFAGVAGACALGAGLGLWARPGLHERQATIDAPKPPAAVPSAARQLEIVVDDHPRLTSAPIEVLSAGSAAPAPTIAPPPAPAPLPRAEGLMQARDTAPPTTAQPEEPSPLMTALPRIAAAFAGARVVLTRLEHPEPAPQIEAPRPAQPNHKAELAKSQARQLEIARADAARAEAHRAALAKAEVEKAELEKAAAAEAEAHQLALAKADAANAQAAKAATAKAAAQRIALAKADAAKAQAAKAAAAKAEARRIALAKADSAKAEAHRQDLARAQAAQAAAHKLELAREAKAEKAEKVRLAKVEARAKAAQREEARLQALADAAEAKKRAQLVRLAHAVARAVVGREAAPPPVQAKPDHRRGHAVAVRKAEPKPTPVKVKARKPPRLAPVQRPQRARPEPAPPPAASGLMKVSTPTRCASRDPGAAIACADPSLSAAERQVARAYQGARAAGVPDGVLQQGQQRWLAARSAAAREAPWAVRDVYMARIAELNGQAREAQEGY